MPITDLPALTAVFKHPAHLEAYLSAFSEGFLAKKFKAIPGKDIELTCAKKKVATRSYAVLADDDFGRWHAEQVERVLKLSFDAQIVASASAYGQISEDLFTLFAEQARQQLKTGQATPEPQGKKSKPAATQKPHQATSKPAESIEEIHPQQRAG